MQLDTIFYVWEAVTTEGPDGPLPKEFRLIHVRPFASTRITSYTSAVPKRTLQNFYLPAECTELIFLRTRLCALHNNGFNLVKLPE